MHKIVHSLLALLFFCGVQAAETPQRYRVEWHIALEAGVDLATVTLNVEDGGAVNDMRMFFDESRFSDFQASGELLPMPGGVAWTPPAKDAHLSYKVRISRERSSKSQRSSYDALMTDTWAVFRGDRVTPRLRVTARKGMEAESLLHFSLPAGWSSNTGWPLYQGSTAPDTYFIGDNTRNFDRPTGWFMVGKLGSRRDYVGSTYLSIVAPLDSGTDRMSWLALISLVYPELEKAFQNLPAKLLVVSGDDPLWRGGLSGPNSFFFHSRRRAISENGTSPLLHELTHVITRISGGDDDDWIAEGIAEYYGIELIYRAGGMSAGKRADVMAALAQWGKSADKLRGDQATGAITARAVGVFDALDQEIHARTAGAANLDMVTRLLMAQRRVSLADLAAAFEKVAGSTSVVLQDLQ